MRSAAAGVADLLAAGGLPPLRGLLGNAGVQAGDGARSSADGYEVTFATNVLATSCSSGA